MRKIFIGLVVFGVLCCIVTLSYADYIIYGDSWSVYPSGYMGGGEVQGSSLTLDDSCLDDPEQGTKCIKVTYDKTKEGWAGIRCFSSYQWDPPDHSMCLNLEGFNKLSFRAKAAENNTLVDFCMGSNDTTEPIHDTCGGNSISTNLLDIWQEFTIDLTGKDMSDINTVFGFGIGGNASITNPVTFYIDDVRYLGLTITDFVALTGFHKGEIDLTWTAPTGEGKVDNYIVKYSKDPILTEDNFNAATTYEPEPEWGSPKLPGELERYTLTGLTPGTFYYVAIKAKGQSGNYGNVSNTKGSYAMARATIIGACVEGSYDFGAVIAGDKPVSTDCFRIKNIGGEVLTFSLNLIDPSPWKAVQSEPTDYNTYILNAMFNSSQPVPEDFNESQHALSTIPVKCGSSVGGKFAGNNEDGVEVPPGDEGERHLWVQFKAPQTSSVGTQQKIIICVTVQSP